MNWRSVESSLLDQVAYDGLTSELHVILRNGRRYVYHMVPRHVFEALLTAQSAGNHFNTRVKGRYPFKEVDG